MKNQTEIQLKLERQKYHYIREKKSNRGPILQTGELRECCELGARRPVPCRDAPTCGGLTMLPTAAGIWPGPASPGPEKACRVPVQAPKAPLLALTFSLILGERVAPWNAYERVRGLLHWGAQASDCGRFSCCIALALGLVGSIVIE